MNRIRLEDAVDGRVHDVDVVRLLVAGFTGRDQHAVREHIEELAAMGVPTPPVTPSVYVLDPALVTQDERIVVDGDDTSGEVEPVLVHVDGRWLLTVGSDHTDRALEREDIAASKAACPKIVGSTCVELTRVDRWDDVTISSHVQHGDAVYQRGRLASLLPPGEILRRLAERHDVVPATGDVLYLGTIPTIGGIRTSPTFSAALRVPGVERELTLSYAIETTDTRERA